jgi:hypothetical protein
VVAWEERADGRKAKVRAVAEWRRTGRRLEVKLWEKQRQRGIPIAPDSAVKWTFEGKRLGKAVVISAKPGERLTVEVPRGAESAELLLPALGAAKKDHVAFFPMGK